jgi:hypothetical protein
MKGFDCFQGCGTQIYNVLAGSILSFWTKVEAILCQNTGGKMLLLTIGVFS